MLIKADARACKQIVLNLVSNAVKFRREGGRVEVSVEAEGAFVRLTVRDNGVGIPADVLPRLGARFRTGGPTISMLAREGTGLGWRWCATWRKRMAAACISTVSRIPAPPSR